MSLPNTLFADRPYFFDAGLRFSCRRCGGCCTGEPGRVFVAASRISAMAAFLNLPEPDLIEAYLIHCQNNYHVKEARDGRCLFYEDGCIIYPVRPIQCQTFPFWFRNLRSLENWHQVMHACPGIGTGLLYSRDQILALIDLDLSDPRNSACTRLPPPLG